MVDRHISIDPVRSRLEELRHAGQTVMLVAVDGRLAGLLGVADSIRASTAEAIQLLHADQMRIIMLTGDNRVTAEAVARTLGIDEVIAEPHLGERGHDPEFPFGCRQRPPAPQNKALGAKDSSDVECGQFAARRP
jgi:magnesium-transporting ATPase (P-type)